MKRFTDCEGPFFLVGRRACRVVPLPSAPGSAMRDFDHVWWPDAPETVSAAELEQFKRGFQAVMASMLGTFGVDAFWWCEPPEASRS